MMAFHPKPSRFMNGIVRCRGTIQKLIACAGIQYAHIAVIVIHSPASYSVTVILSAMRPGTSVTPHSPFANDFNPKNVGR